MTKWVTFGKHLRSSDRLLSVTDKHLILLCCKCSQVTFNSLSIIRKTIMFIGISSSGVLLRNRCKCETLLSTKICWLVKVFILKIFREFWTNEAFNLVWAYNKWSWLKWESLLRLNSFTRVVLWFESSLK